VGESARSVYCVVAVWIRHRLFTSRDVELGRLIEHLYVDRCIFRSNHACNYLPLAGTLMKDRERLLAAVRRALEQPDRFLRDEWLRGL
jgi:hypothetical protein